MSEHRLLIVFAKNPEMGRVKTRLAETMGERKALEVYRGLLDQTLRVAAKCRCDRELWFSRYLPEQEESAPNGFRLQLQQGDDLGERMKHAFFHAFEKGYEKVVIIGSDCAELTGEVLEQAFLNLEDHDLVLGPSEDGGYYLLGMKKYYEELFEGISWSTEAVFQQTMSKAEESGHSVATLAELNDIDNEADWHSVKDKF